MLLPSEHRFWVSALSATVCFLSAASAGLRYNYGDGSFYVGQVDEKGRPDGVGKYFNTSGALEYDGEFASGARSGWGTWYGADGSRLEGSFRRGLANGRGTLKTAAEDKIEGDFVDHMPHGKVLMQRPNGERIEGQFRYGMPHGRVEWRLPSGLRMDGMFRMGRPHGFVRVYDDEGGLVFEGRFFNGRPKTKGKKANPASFEAYSAAPLTAAAATESDAAAASDLTTTTITGNEIAGMFRFHREPEEARRSKA